jgi:hypothetical protein
MFFCNTNFRKNTCVSIIFVLLLFPGFRVFPRKFMVIKKVPALVTGLSKPQV